MDIIELRNGLSINCKSLTRQEYDSLKQQINVGFIARFKTGYGIDVHLVKGKEVIVKEGDYYTLYYSIDDLEKVLLDATDSSSMGKEVMLNKNTQGQKFPAVVDSLVDNLLDSLGIKSSVRDLSLLKIIDGKLEQLSDADSFKKRHFIHLVAALGSVLQQEYHAEWDMELSSDHITWNPFMKIGGERIQFFVYLYEDIYMKSTSSLLFDVYLTVRTIIKNNHR